MSSSSGSGSWIFLIHTVFIRLVHVRTIWKRQNKSATSKIQPARLYSPMRTNRINTVIWKQNSIQGLQLSNNVWYFFVASWNCLTNNWHRQQPATARGVSDVRERGKNRGRGDIGGKKHFSVSGMSSTDITLTVLRAIFNHNLTVLRAIFGPEFNCLKIALALALAMVET